RCSVPRAKATRPHCIVARRYPVRSRTAAAPRIGPDGKVDIFCPNCGTRYRLAEAALDSKVECSVCTDRFEPRQTVGKFASGKDHRGVYALFGLGALVIVGGLILLSNSEPMRPIEHSQQQSPEAASLNSLERERARRRDQVVKWGQKIAAGETFVIREYSDLP